MHWPFRKTSDAPRKRALRKGWLIDMQKEPFLRFNQFAKLTFPVAMSVAAHREFIKLSNTAHHRAISEDFRWISLLQSLGEVDLAGDFQETMWEHSVIEPDGFVRSKTVKLVSAADDLGNEALTFMLPEESLKTILRVL
jgi:hypothetical protein